MSDCSLMRGMMSRIATAAAVGRSLVLPRAFLRSSSSGLMKSLPEDSSAI